MYKEKRGFSVEISVFRIFAGKLFLYALFPRLLTNPDRHTAVSMYIILFSQVATLL